MNEDELFGVFDDASAPVYARPSTSTDASKKKRKASPEPNGKPALDSTGTGSAQKRSRFVEAAADSRAEVMAAAPAVLPQDSSSLLSRPGVGKSLIEAVTGPGSSASAPEAMDTSQGVGAAAAAGEEAETAPGDGDFAPLASAQLLKDVSHEVAYPPGKGEEDFPAGINNPPYPEAPVREYPFTLDPFQRASVCIIERGDSVLVSAHTSAGKTVVAEYAIAHSLAAKQRVIYTSPIKALSNQKYRELEEQFGDVGLMTGDVTISPSASCLVMTTEILRSMIYRGSEVLREVAWVVFDEIHYMRDKERGVVWEETLSLLPNSIRFVFLSATIPNAREFASWIAFLHDAPCHVVYTEFRPTPLQHYIFPAGGNGVHLIVDEQGKFREDSFQKALSSIKTTVDMDGRNGRGGRGGRGGGRGGRGGGRGGANGKASGSDIYRIVRMVMERNFQPVIVFAFSKKDCERLALAMAKLDFNSKEEKDLVSTMFKNAVDSLSEDDRQLQQVVSILPLLQRGIGIHHSGLLPILKEVIELLFQEGLLKCLFATETFSMGLNMPAKTVIFTSVRKFDGKGFRWITSGEYIQMSGRAGRRGLDDRGIVIVMVDQQMEPDVARGMLQGLADPLNSSFYISYNMLLNLLRVDEVNPEYMLQRSFQQFQVKSKVPALKSKLEDLEQAISGIDLGADPGALSHYVNAKAQLSRLESEKLATIQEPRFSLPFLRPGRIVRVADAKRDWGWGPVIGWSRRNPAGTSKQEVTKFDSASQRAAAKTYLVDVLLRVAAGSINAGSVRPALDLSTPGEWAVLPALLTTVVEFNTIVLTIPDGGTQLDAHSRKALGASVERLRMTKKDAIPVLDPVTHMKIDDEAFLKIPEKIVALRTMLSESPVAADPRAAELVAAAEQRSAMESEVRSLKKEIRTSEDLVAKDDLRARMRVLRRLGYTDASNVVDVKGRVAADVNTADELVLTELIFNGVFTELNVQQTTALLSCLVFQERTKEESKSGMSAELEVAFKALQDAVKRVSTVSAESKVSLPEDYEDSFNPALMSVVAAWTLGAKFSEICGMTDVFEGSIIRAMRRLEELLRQLVGAAKSIGNNDLEAKFSQGINLIKRDIVFAASLYL